jgi:transitional endoplasmic reticulum ATPase
VIDDLAVGPQSAIARVIFASDGGQQLVIEYRNMNVATVSFAIPSSEYLVGDILFVRDNTLEHAPAELWEDDPWIGTVRLVREDVTIVEQAGRLLRLPTVADVDCAEGNTVECVDRRIVRVLADEPLRTIDIRQEEPIDVAVFRTDPSADGGEHFDSFGGMPDIVDRALELVRVPLVYSESLQAIGARSIRGVLFTGPPGTGKTMLARIIANESDATFYAISGPTIFSKWFGESEDLLRRIFEDAAKQTRSIIFFDEIDSVAVRRDDDAHEQSKRVVAQLLTLMDGFAVADKVVVIAATNRPEAIDDALRRPGRFDWEIEFRVPLRDERVAILERSGRDIASDGPLPHTWIAAMSDGWSAADLTAIWSEAALLAVVDERQVIVAEDYLGGFERVAAQRRRTAATTPRAA